MKKNRLIIFVFLIWPFHPSLVSAQNFQNGDLEGTVVVYSTLPPNWQSIPYTDPLCLASGTGYDSPDLTSINAPDIAYGVIGNPYSGSTFVSGLTETFPSSTSVWHEGIQQTLTGFTVGQVYTIHFQQAVVKQLFELDRSGSWAVYIDNTLAGITPPTYSAAAFNSTSFIWEAKAVSFMATSVAHVIKFLPMDDDTNQNSSTTDTTGALRMGIDAISMVVGEVGLADAPLSIAATVYPNPGSGAFMLDLGDMRSAENASVDIIDLTGQIVLSIPAEGKKIIPLDMNNMGNGIYFIHVLLSDERIAVLRVVKE